MLKAEKLIIWLEVFSRQKLGELDFLFPLSMCWVSENAEETMAGPVKPLGIADPEREELKHWLRRHQMPAAEQLRARIIFSNTTGIAGHEIGRHDCQQVAQAL